MRAAIPLRAGTVRLTCRGNMGRGLVAERFDDQDREWPQRPWIMGAIGAAGGLVVHLLTDGHSGYNQSFPIWKQAATAFTVVATVAFLLTVELRRWTWAIGFSIGWAAVIAL